MAKVTLTDLSNLQNEASVVSTLAANNALVEAAIENTLSRDGTTPNTMTAGLDMNSQRITNLVAAENDTEPVRKAEFDAGVADIITGSGAFSSLTAHGILVASSSLIATSTIAGTDGQIPVGQTSANPVFKTVSGDATMSSTGALTVTKTGGVALTSASTTSIGTSGATIPLLSTANTWTLAQTFTLSPVLTVGIEVGHATDTTLTRSSAGVLAVEGVVIPSVSSTNTFTNKRITPRSTVTSIPGATPTVNSDNSDYVELLALNTAITSMTTNLSGTPTNGQRLTFRLKDNGTARAITWGASFEACGVSLPTTTVVSKRLTVLFIYDAVALKWGCVAAAQEA